MTIIKSKEFILRPFKRGDEESIRKNINNKKIYHYTLSIPYPYTLKHAQQWVGKKLKQAKQKKLTGLDFAIVVDGEVVGAIGFSLIKGHRTEMGYWLAEKYWNKGIMTKAIKLMTKFGFEKLKLKRIHSHVFSFNKASMRVLQKAGYKKEGILRKHVIKDKKLIDAHVFAKVTK